MALAARLLLSFQRGRGLLARSHPVPEGRLHDALCEAAARLGLPAVPRLVASGEIRSPMVWCWGRRPVLLLPASALEGADAVDWVSIFCHELAHWKRRDHWSSLAGEILTALLPWHLLTWWARRRLHHLGERACDDWVLASGRSPVTYAESLLGLLPQRRPGLALTAVRGRRSLVRRIRHILDGAPKRPRAGRCWTALATLGVLLVTAVLALGQTRPVVADGAAPRSSTPSPRARPQAKPEQRITLTGRVLADGDRPVPNAPVTALTLAREEWSGPKVLDRTTADRRGRFRLRVPAGWLAPGQRVVLVAGGKGHGPGWHFVKLPRQGAPTETVIRLRPEQVRHGRLIDLQGQPAAGVKLHVIRLGKPIEYYHKLEAMHRRYVGNDESLFLVGGITRHGLGDLGFWATRRDLPFWPEPVTTDAQGRFTLQGIGRGQPAGVLTGDDRFAFQELDVPPPSQGKPAAAIVLTPARLVEGTVTAADTGRPIRGARVPESSLSCRVCHVNGSGRGESDWKGRRRSHASLEEGDRHWEGLYSIDGRADARGRFRINAFWGRSVSLRVSAPPGEPYLQRVHTVTWERGMARREVDFALPRGVVVGGKVTDAASGQPLAGVRVDYWSKGLKLPAGVVYPDPAETGPDGAFRMVLPPGRGHLLINGPTAEYLFQPIPIDRLREVNPREVEARAGSKGEKPHYRPDAWVALDLKPGSEPQRVDVRLRRVVMQGRLVGPDGKPIDRAVMFRRDGIPPSGNVRPVDASGGRFAFPVQDLGASYPVLFLDAAHRLGAVADLPGQLARGRPVTVRLQPCGSATARFVNANGKPLANYRPVLWLPVPPGPVPTLVQRADPDGRRLLVVYLNREMHGGENPVRVWAPDAVWVGHADPRHYGAGPRTDAQGRITLPALIPRASYRLAGPPGGPKEFVVESGKVHDLGDVTVRKPGPLEQLPHVNRLYRQDGGQAKPRSK
jgi:hypothetical protein